MSKKFSGLVIPNNEFMLLPQLPYRVFTYMITVTKITGKYPTIDDYKCWINTVYRSRMNLSSIVNFKKFKFELGKRNRLHMHFMHISPDMLKNNWVFKHSAFNVRVDQCMDIEEYRRCDKYVNKDQQPDTCDEELEVKQQIYRPKGCKIIDSILERQKYLFTNFWEMKNSVDASFLKYGSKYL